jgi:hypothetical protein
MPAAAPKKRAQAKPKAKKTQVDATAAKTGKSEAKALAAAKTKKPVKPVGQEELEAQAVVREPSEITAVESNAAPKKASEASTNDESTAVVETEPKQE